MDDASKSGVPSVAVSACLLGERCTWRGDSNALPEETIARLRKACRLVAVCPEVQGGLSTPRQPSEIAAGRVVAKSGEDVTAQFETGAALALAEAQAARCELALLKEKSPSCGCGFVYDGTFSGALVPGNGVAAQMMLDAGIEVFGESRVGELLERLAVSSLS